MKSAYALSKPLPPGGCLPAGVGKNAAIAAHSLLPPVFQPACASQTDFRAFVQTLKAHAGTLGRIAYYEFQAGGAEWVTPISRNTYPRNSFSWPTSPAFSFAATVHPVP